MEMNNSDKWRSKYVLPTGIFGKVGVGKQKKCNHIKKIYIFLKSICSTVADRLSGLRGDRNIVRKIRPAQKQAERLKKISKIAPPHSRLGHDQICSDLRMSDVVFISRQRASLHWQPPPMEMDTEIEETSHVSLHHVVPAKAQEVAPSTQM